MAKEIPADKLKVAVAALNAIIETGKIKTIAAKKTDVIALFKAKMDEFIAADKTDILPDVSVDFYNEFIADDDGADAGAGEEKAEKTSGKKTKTKTEKPAKAEKPPKEKKEKVASTVERDAFGASVNSKTHQFVVMISEKPTKMADAKAALGDSYYNFARKNPDTILKNALGYFYVKGSPAEKLALEMKVEEAGVKVEKAPPAKKTPAKTEKAPAKTEKAPTKTEKAEPADKTEPEGKKAPVTKKKVVVKKK